MSEVPLFDQSIIPSGDATCDRCGERYANVTGDVGTCGDRIRRDGEERRMPTQVVNIRTQTDPDAFIYVGRRCKHPVFGWLKGHYFANPFKVSPKATDEEKKECLKQYHRWLIEELATDVGYQEMRGLVQLVQWRNKPLGCWCGNWDGVNKPAPLCHAVILASEADKVLSNGG